MKSYCISRDMIILGMKSANQMVAFRDAEKLDCKWVRLQIASTVKKYFLLLVIIIIVLWKALKLTLPYFIVFVCCHISESYFMGPGFFFVDHVLCIFLFLAVQIRCLRKSTLGNILSEPPRGLHGLLFYCVMIFHPAPFWQHGCYDRII